MKTLHGLYAITDATLINEHEFVTAVESALQGGAAIIQYRDKSDDDTKRLNQALALKQLCDKFNANLIINDDIELALQVDADGVHIGIDDIPFIECRKKVGPNKIIGVSCYNRFELAQNAAAQGADYIAFGSFFSSPTKPDATRAELHLLNQAKQNLDIPVCAIGGITLNNASQLVEAGADMLAVISSIFSARDIVSASSAFKQLFNR